jgi:hypothetical protein
MRNLLGETASLRETFASWRTLLKGQRRDPSKTVSVFLFGQSHVVCLKAAWKRRLYRPKHRGLDYKFILSGERQFPSEQIVVRSLSTGTDVLHAGLAHAFDHYGVYGGSTETWLVSIVRGNACNIFGLFEPEPPFDFVHPADPELPLRTDAQLLPYDAVRTIFGHYSRRTASFFKCLPRNNIAGILHVEAPPPIPNERQVYRSVERILLRRVLGRSRGARVSPREFRMKLWKAQCDVNREMCAEHGIIYVTPPEEALDGEGYLLPKAWFGATHASAWYGALVLRKIEAVIAGERSRQ